jgi:hypothetical protein
LKLTAYTSPQLAAPQIYINTLKSAKNTVSMITLFLQGKTISEVSSILNIPFTAVNNCRYRYKDLINIYLESGVIYLPE